jgi:hypothetical protein
VKPLAFRKRINDPLFIPRYSIQEYSEKRMLTLTHRVKNKWLRRGHLELNQEHSAFATLRKFVGICLLNQVPEFTYCILHSNSLSRKKCAKTKSWTFFRMKKGGGWPSTPEVSRKRSGGRGDGKILLKISGGI